MAVDPGEYPCFRFAESRDRFWSRNWSWLHPGTVANPKPFLFLFQILLAFERVPFPVIFKLRGDGNFRFRIERCQVGFERDHVTNGSWGRGAHTANTRRWSNVILMLGQRRRRWANIKIALYQLLVFAVQPHLPSIYMGNTRAWTATYSSNLTGKSLRNRRVITFMENIWYY